MILSCNIIFFLLYLLIFYWFFTKIDIANYIGFGILNMNELMNIENLNEKDLKLLKEKIEEKLKNIKILENMKKVALFEIIDIDSDTSRYFSNFDEMKSSLRELIEDDINLLSEADFKVFSNTSIKYKISIAYVNENEVKHYISGIHVSI